LGFLDNICPVCGRRYPSIGRVKIAMVLLVVGGGTLLLYGILTFGLSDIDVLVELAFFVTTAIVLVWQYESRKRER